MADEPTQEPIEGEPEVPAPKVQYLGKEWDTEELVDELRKKDAHITRQSQELAANKQPDTPAEPSNEEEEAQWAVAKKKLGLPSDKSLDAYLDDKFAQREQTAKVTSQIDSLKNKYKGEGEYKDYPKFDEQEVIQYAQQKNIFDLEVAYRDMNYAKVLDAEAKKVSGKSKAVQGDTSDAPRVEAQTKETLRKKLTPEVLSDTTKLAQVMKEMGMGDLPSN